MNGIFISHSTKDRKFVEQIVEFLQLGMGVELRKIFCTSLYGTLPTGEDFIKIIKNNVKDRGMVLAVITPEYLKSQFCMMELGAAWAGAERLYPILALGTEYKDLESSPLAKVQMRKADQERDWGVIYDELVKYQMISVNTPRFYEKLPQFMESISRFKRKSDQLYTSDLLPDDIRFPAGAKPDPLYMPDPSGYYSVTIEAERSVPSAYRCYKIKGKLVIEGLQKWLDSESHWIFYTEGAYDDPKVGDQVRLKISKTERRTFPDIGFARNIYPADMEVIG